MLGFREICVVTAALPMVTLFICFVSAVVFQFDDVHETHCRVRVSFDWFGLLTPFTTLSIKHEWVVARPAHSNRFVYFTISGFQFYTIDKRHNGHQSKYLFLANKYCIACRTAIYNCHLLQKLLRAYAMPCQESNSPQQRHIIYETCLLVTPRWNHIVVRCHVHFEPRKLR